MKLTSVAVLLLATAVAGISQQSGEKTDNSKRALQEGNAGVSKRAPAASPQGGIEYAVSKESQAGKLGQQIYESPGLTKISDILSGHGPGYQAAISSHLYAPLSIYQQRLGSPTYEISAPVASQLAYSEHKIYQVPQNSINYPQTEKLQEKQPFKQYQVLQPQSLIAQAPLLYQQRLIPISQGQPVYQPINALIPPGQQLPQNLPPQLQYQPLPYQQQTPITPDDPIYVGGTQLQPLQLHVQQLLPKGYSSVQLYQNPIPQLPHYNQQQPLIGLLQSFPPAPTLQARPLYQPVQEVQKTQAPVTITVQPPAAYTKQDDLNQRLNLRDLKNTATPQPQQQGAVSYSSLSLGQTNTQYNVQPLQTPQKGQHQQRTVSPLVYQTLQNHPNLILTDNVQQSVLKPLLIHHLTYTKPQLKQIQQQLNEQLQLNLQEQFSLQQQKLNQQQQANQLQQASQLQQAAQQQQAKQQQQVNQQNLVIQQQQLKQQQQLNQQQQTLNQQQQQLNQQQQSGPQLYLNQQQHLTQQQLSPLTYTKQAVTAAPTTSQSPSSTTKFLPVQYFGKYAESIFGNFSN